MPKVDHRTHGRTDFPEALKLLALAGSRLPFGVPDPVLSGAGAVHLYTGGLWSSGDLEVLAADARALTAELFAVGFRWSRRPFRATPGLWHPELRIGVDIVEISDTSGIAEPSHQLRLAIDRERFTPTDVLSLAVIGIEDLIVQLVGCWRKDGAPSGERGDLLQALLGLGRDGVGGGFDIGYLRRRLAHETNGDVVIETVGLEAGRAQIGGLRTIGLAEMHALIRAWRVRHGLPSNAQGATDFDGSSRLLLRSVDQRFGTWGRDGWSGSSSQPIVPFDTVL
jgi:hypothetical protein